MMTVAGSKGEDYTVDPASNTCTCPHFVHRLAPLNQHDGGQRQCKHLEMVARLLQDEQEAGSDGSQ